MFKPKDNKTDEKKKKFSRPKLFRGFWKSKDNSKQDDIEIKDGGVDITNESPLSEEVNSQVTDTTAQTTNNQGNVTKDVEKPPSQRLYYKAKPERRTIMVKPKGIQRITDQQSLRGSMKIDIEGQVAFDEPCEVIRKRSKSFNDLGKLRKERQDSDIYENIKLPMPHESIDKSQIYQNTLPHIEDDDTPLHRTNSSPRFEHGWIAYDWLETHVLSETKKQRDEDLSDDEWNLNSDDGGRDITPIYKPRLSVESDEDTRLIWKRAKPRAILNQKDRNISDVDISIDNHQVIGNTEPLIEIQPKSLSDNSSQTYINETGAEKESIGDQNPEEEKRSTFLDDETNKTLEEIIKRFTNVPRDTQLQDAFLITLPFIVSPTTLVEELGRLHDAPEDSFKNSNQSKCTVQKNMLAFCQEWIETNFKYFLDPMPLMCLFKFLYSIRKGSSEHSKAKIQERSCVPYVNSIIKIIQMKFNGIDLKDLVSTIYKMKNSIRTSKKVVSYASAEGTILSEEKEFFLGTDAYKWIRKLQEENFNALTSSFGKKRHVTSIWPLLEFDPHELLSQALTENLIDNLPRTKEITNPMEFKKTRRYTFNLSKETEDECYMSLLKIDIQPPKNIDFLYEVREKKFTMFDPVVFAQQLIIVEMNMLKKLEAHEFHFWIKGDKLLRERMAPNLHAIISHVNHMTYWIPTEIVSEQDPFTRASILKKFILIAEACYEYKNYQGVLEIVYGIASSSVQRLKAWKQLDTKFVQIYEKVSQAVSPSNNWKTYRTLIQEANGACIPYVGLILSDLTFIQDGIPTRDENNLIHWKKVLKIYNIFQNLKKHQNQTYNFKHADHNIIRFLSEEAVYADEKMIYNISKTNEPDARRARSNSIY